jgi:hypothetical protein
MTLIKNDIPEGLLHLVFNDLKATIEKSDKVHVNLVKSYYAASLIDPDFAETFRKESKSGQFWEDSFPDSWDSADDIYYLTKINLPNKEAVDQVISHCILDAQNRHGCIMNEHAKALRTLVSYDRFSSHTDLALKYFLDSIQNLSDLSPYEFSEIPAGMLALMELDFDRHKGTLSELADFLISNRLENGGFGRHKISDISNLSIIEDTCASIVALSRFLGPDNLNVVSALNFIQATHASEGWYPYLAADTCIALVEAGLGPRVSKAVADWNVQLLRQRHLKGLPKFIHTSPLYGGKIHVKQIYEKILEMLQRAEREVLISSLYVDMMYEELINMANRGLLIKIVMRPSRDAKGLRERINKNVVELLKIATKGNARVNTTCHTRMVIIDSKEMIVSTADLTRDQLYDEFNAGIWTEHPDTVIAAVKFFENVWSMSDPS